MYKGRSYRSIFDVHTLTFLRKGEGYLDANRKWIEPETPLEAIGDLQPYTPQQLRQFELPEGFVKRGAKQFSTKANLNTVEDYTITGADSTVIGNRRYYVGIAAEWDNGVLSTDYNTYVLILQALPNEGAIT